jgi:hypothetical protein
MLSELKALSPAQFSFSRFQLPRYSNDCKDAATTSQTTKSLYQAIAYRVSHLPVCRGCQVYKIVY